MPSAIMYDALVQLSLKFAAILLSGNIALNKSPMLSTDRRLKLLTDTFASQKISAFMLSPGVINPRDCDEQAELSPDCFEKATSFFCFLSTLCLIASMCSFAYYAVTTEFSLHCHTSPAHHRTDNMLGIHSVLSCTIHLSFAHYCQLRRAKFQKTLSLWHC